MKLVLRLLTVSSYFLPFTFFVVTCSNPLDVKFSYNQAEVDKNVMLAESYPKAQIVSTSEQDSVSQKTFNEGNSTSQTGPSDSTVVETGLMELSDRTNNIWDAIAMKVMMPKENSLSGIGVIFYFKNWTGQILMAVSLLTSLICLSCFRFLKDNYVKRRLLLFNIFVLITFVIVIILCDVTLLFGVGVSILLLGIQFLLEWKGDLVKKSG